MSFTVNTLRTVATSCQQMRDHIKTVVFRPDAHKKLDITFGPTQAAALLGRTPEAIAKAEAKGRLPQPQQLGNGRRYYMIEDQIGRASCRERVGQNAKITVVAVALKKTNIILALRIHTQYKSNK